MRVSRTRSIDPNFRGTLSVSVCGCVSATGFLVPLRLLKRHERPSKLRIIYRAEWRQTPAWRHRSCCVKVVQFRPVFEHPTA